MREAVIVDAVRSPLGKRKGGLSGVHSADLLAHVLESLVSRTGIDPGQVDDVIGGCVVQVGEQAGNVTRNAWLGAGFPDTVPATTIDRQCGSSQQAAHFGAQGVMAGAYDLVVACGVESMSRLSMFAHIGDANPYGERMLARYSKRLVHQGVCAEFVAHRWGVTRDEADTIALQSHHRAAAARESGAFQAEIAPVAVVVDGEKRLIAMDEGIRDTSTEQLAALKPAFRTDEVAARHPELEWIVTAGNASQMADGAAAILIATPEMWRFREFAVVGSDPTTMLTGVIPATQRVLARAGMSIGDIDHFEISEAFAPVIGAWLRETGADLAKVNPRGGGIALGHPTGASGARLMTTLVHALAQSGGRFGLQAMCEGGGTANATIIERIS
jgi:acetyl-CoA acyltransferase